MTAFTVSVIIILILLIILFENIEIRVTASEKLIITVSGVLFSFQFSRFAEKKRKKKKAPHIPSLLRALKFFFGRARIEIHALPSHPPVSSPWFGIYRATLALLLAYSDTKTGKLFLPKEGEEKDGTYFDVTFKIRLWVIASFFVIYKLRKVSGVFPSVRE